MGEESPIFQSMRTHLMSLKSLLPAFAFRGKIGRLVREACVGGLVVAMLVGTAWGGNNQGGNNQGGNNQGGNNQGGNNQGGGGKAAPEIDPGSAIGALTI